MHSNVLAIAAQFAICTLCRRRAQQLSLDSDAAEAHVASAARGESLEAVAAAAPSAATEEPATAMPADAADPVAPEEESAGQREGRTAFLAAQRRAARAELHQKQAMTEPSPSETDAALVGISAEDADRAVPTPASGGAALTAVPAKAARLLPPGWDARLGGRAPADEHGTEGPGAVAGTSGAAASGGRIPTAQRQDGQLGGAGEDDMGTDQPADAPPNEDVLEQLLGHLGVSEEDQPQARPHSIPHQAANPSAVPHGVHTDLRVEHVSAVAGAIVAAPFAGRKSSHNAGRRRVAAPQADALLLCPITQVGHCASAACPLRFVVGMDEASPLLPTLPPIALLNSAIHHVVIDLSIPCGRSACANR